MKDKPMPIPRRMADLIKNPPPKPRHNQRWGPWRLDAKKLTLDLLDERGNEEYIIDLRDIRDSATLLDWIYQVHSKALGEETMVALLDAFGEIYSPQANLCSFGGNKEINPEDFLRKELLSDQE